MRKIANIFMKVSQMRKSLRSTTLAILSNICILRLVVSTLKSLDTIIEQEKSDMPIKHKSGSKSNNLQYIY